MPRGPIVVPDTPPIISLPPIPRYPETVLGVWKFDGTLEDQVSTFDFSPSSGSAEYSTFEKFELIPNTTLTRSALLFEETKFYRSEPDYQYPTNFTLAFWYYSPQHVGFTRHVYTRELESKIAPIIAKSNYSQTDTRTNLTEASFIVTEIAASKTQNAIQVYLCQDGTNVSHVITSEPFDTPGLHHILMTFIHSQGRFRIDVDGKSGVLQSAPTAGLSGAGDFYINSVVPGFLAHKTIQTGAYIFDLVFTRYDSRDNEALKAFRYGYEHISYEELFDTRFAYFGISYPQPSTISTTHLFVDGGNIFAARSNGEIVKGARPIWNKEFDFPESESLRQLTISRQDTIQDEIQPNDRVASWTPKGLKIQGVSVRI